MWYGIRGSCPNVYDSSITNFMYRALQHQVLDFNQSSPELGCSLSPVLPEEGVIFTVFCLLKVELEVFEASLKASNPILLTTLCSGPPFSKSKLSLMLGTTQSSTPGYQVQCHGHLCPTRCLTSGSTYYW